MLLQQNRDIGSRRRRLGNENESGGRGEDQNTKHKENRGGSFSAAARSRINRRNRFASQPSADEQGQCREGGHDVILLACRKAEENKNEQRPDAAEQVGPTAWIKSCISQAETNLRYRLWQECAPRQQPYEQQSPKEQQGHGVVVFGIARAQETLDVLIDEIKPEKSSRLSGGRVTQAREDVPGCGDN